MPPKVGKTRGSGSDASAGALATTLKLPPKHSSPFATSTASPEPAKSPSPRSIHLAREVASCWATPSDIPGGSAAQSRMASLSRPTSATVGGREDPRNVLGIRRRRPTSAPHLRGGRGNPGHSPPRRGARPTSAGSLWSQSSKAGFIKVDTGGDIYRTSAYFSTPTEWGPNGTVLPDGTGSGMQHPPTPTRLLIGLGPQHSPFVDFDVRGKRLALERRILESDEKHVEASRNGLRHDMVLNRLAKKGTSSDDLHDYRTMYGPHSVKIRRLEARRTARCCTSPGPQSRPKSSSAANEVREMRAKLLSSCERVRKDVGDPFADMNKKSPFERALRLRVRTNSSSPPRARSYSGRSPAAPGRRRGKKYEPRLTIRQDMLSKLLIADLVGGADG